MNLCPNCGSTDIERHVMKTWEGADLFNLDGSRPSFSCNACWIWFEETVPTYQLALPLEGDQLTLEV